MTTLHVKEDSVCLVECHLSSNNYNESFEDVRVSNDTGYMTSIPYASGLRKQETLEIVSSLPGCKVIVLGDMNDVWGSGSLSILKDANLKDAWWEGGFGYGATIHRPLPYRIDHIMYSGDMNLIDIKIKDAKGLSDHDALVADFKIN